MLQRCCVLVSLSVCWWMMFWRVSSTMSYCARFFMLLRMVNVWFGCTQQWSPRFSFWRSASVCLASSVATICFFLSSFEAVCLSNWMCLMDNSTIYLYAKRILVSCCDLAAMYIRAISPTSSPKSFMILLLSSRVSLHSCLKSSYLVEDCSSSTWLWHREISTMALACIAYCWMTAYSSLCVVLLDSPTSANVKSMCVA